MVPPQQFQIRDVKSGIGLTFGKGSVMEDGLIPDWILFFFLSWSENCGWQAGEEEPGAHKKARREGERGKDEEEVSACF